MDLEEVVSDLKNKGASRKVITTRLKELDVGFVQRQKLLKGMKRSRNFVIVDNEVFLKQYFTILITSLILLVCIFYYFINPNILYTSLLYLIYFTAVFVPLTIILRLMADSFTGRGYAGKHDFGIQDYVFTILITGFVILTNYHAVLMAFFVGIPIVLILIVFYRMTAIEAFITTLTMGAYIYLLTTLWYYVNPYIESVLSALLL